MTNQVLSPEQRAAFQRDGFLVLPDFVDAGACIELRDRALELAKELTPRPEDATARRKPGHGRAFFVAARAQSRGGGGGGMPRPGGGAGLALPAGTCSLM